MSEAITADMVYQTLQKIRASYAEPDCIVISRNQADDLNILLRSLELSNDPILFAAFCAGYELRRSAKVKINARVIREFKAFCYEMAKAYPSDMLKAVEEMDQVI